MEIIFGDIIIAVKDEHEHDAIMKKLLLRGKEAKVKFQSSKAPIQSLGNGELFFSVHS